VLRHVVESTAWRTRPTTRTTRRWRPSTTERRDIPSLVRCIRWGELYGLLEDATDRAEDVANTLEGIVLKYA
jgi:hypothetical protein